ncbi:hypothetical protein CFOL_v3_21238 [Cephalotus follicularis]|uniref:Uncharacterized protein n=1 Tax=Cephalotus follicularis TaxID=3775 RepID=A0A1Q3CCC5_CEPFO|nr:hypothetical protein CFOL_v3_21238 [Cephalotus follicularis]
MAENLPNSSSSSPPSASHSATQPAAPPPPFPLKVEPESDNGAPNEMEQKPHIAMDHFAFLNSAEYVGKYKKYQSDYTRRLMAKYFTKKDLYGGMVFDEKSTVDDETIMSSRWPCPRSFADPVRAFEDQSSSGSTPSHDDPSNISNGKPLTPKKSG